MVFQYKYRNNAADMWRMSMQQVYTSMIGIFNILFTVAIISATIAIWPKCAVAVRVLMLTGCMLFIVIQPVSVWAKAKKMAETITEDTSIMFSEEGLHIEQSGKNQDIPWSRIPGMKKGWGFLIVFSGGAHGYVLPDRVTKEQKEDLCRYIESKIKERRK